MGRQVALFTMGDPVATHCFFCLLFSNSNALFATLLRLEDLCRLAGSGISHSNLRIITESTLLTASNKNKTTQSTTHCFSLSFFKKKQSSYSVLISPNHKKTSLLPLFNMSNSNEADQLLQLEARARQLELSAVAATQNERQTNRPT